MIDTNVLAYAANHAAPECTTCRSRLDAWVSDGDVWYLRRGVIYEFLRVATHPRVFSRPLDASQAWAFIQAILGARGVGVLLPGPRHRAILDELIGSLPWLAGNILHDVETVALMKEHGVRRNYTRDTDFHRLPFIEVVDPLLDHRAIGAG